MLLSSGTTEPAVGKDARQHRPVSVRSRLASLVLACVLPVWIVAGLLVYYNYRSKRELTEQRMLETSRALSQVVDRELSNMQATLNVISTMLVSGDLPGFYRFAQKVQREYPGSNVVVSNVQAHELINLNLPFGAPLSRRGAPDAVRQVFVTGRPFVSGVYKGPVTGRLVVSMDVPVYRDGKIAYALAMVLPADHFAAVLSQQHLPPEWIGAVVGGDNTIVARTRLPERFVGTTAKPDLLRFTEKTREGIAEIPNLEGTLVFDSFTRSSVSGWMVVIGVPRTIVLAEIRQGLWWTIAGAALLSLTGILLALRMARHIAGSIQGLIPPALALGRGEPITVGHLDLAETTQVGESLVRASQLIQERAAERERAEAARRETEELKRLNAELEKSEAEARARAAELAAITDAAPAITFIAQDPECQLITSNRAGYALLRLPPGTNVSLSAPENERILNFRMLRDGKELSCDELPVQLAASGREVRDREFTIAFEDGSSRDIFGSAVPLLDETGRVRGAMSAYIDITDHKRAQAQLEATAARLQAILTSAPIGINIVNWEGQLLETNPALSQILGYPQEELAGQFTKYTHPDDVEKSMELHRSLGRGERQSYELEKRFIRRDGSVIWARVSASKLNQEVSVSTVEDITERVLAREQLTQTAERLQLVLDRAPVGIVIINRENRFTETNAAFQQMTGCSGGELQLMGWKDFTHPEDVTRNAGLIDGIMSGELSSYELETRYLLKDRRTIWVRIIGCRLDQSYMISMIEDITARKQAEEEQEKLQAQLSQARKMESIGRLAGGIAHDFNNLLMVIQSYTELVQDGLPAHSPLRNSTREITKAAERAAGLTGQLLAFSRKQILSPVVLDLNAAVIETAKMLRRLIGEDVELRVSAAESLWPVKADSDQMVQVLMNLCINARDSMPKGGTLTIATANLTVGAGGNSRMPYVKPGDYVKLAVTDTGTGISKDLQEKIFEPFFTTKEVGKGTGLGLAMVYGIAKQSGGYVGVDSEPGQGACFTIYLPRAADALAPEAPAKAEAQLRGTETLLVAEDESALREVICGYLRGLGYTVLPASSGQQALAVTADCEHIDLLITDLIMPRMSGRELSEMLRSSRPDLKTIFMSGYAEDAVLHHGVHKPGIFFLQKPFSMTTLAKRIRDSLD